MHCNGRWTYPGFVESCELGIRVAVGVSSCPPVSWHSLVRPLGEPFFRPDPHIVRPSRAAAVKDGPFWGRPEGVSLTVVSTTAGWSASGATFRPSPCVRAVAARIGSEPLGARVTSSGSVRTGVQGQDSGAAASAGEFIGRDCLARGWCERGDVGALAGGCPGQGALRL